MVSLVAEIPVYLQGKNPKCIDAIMRWLTAILDLQIDHEDLRIHGEQYEKKVTQIVNAQPELANHIARLEEDYDNEVFDSQMDDLKDLLYRQGIRLD